MTASQVFNNSVSVTTGSATWVKGGGVCANDYMALTLVGSTSFRDNYAASPGGAQGGAVYGPDAAMLRGLTTGDVLPGRQFSTQTFNPATNVWFYTEYNTIYYESGDVVMPSKAPTVTPTAGGSPQHTFRSRHIFIDALVKASPCTPGRSCYFLRSSVTWAAQFRELTSTASHCAGPSQRPSLTPTLVPTLPPTQGEGPSLS
jgi:predicted outer membrane repeat protein